MTEAGTGYLKVRAASAGDAFPTEGVTVIVYDGEGALLASLRTDSSGLTETISLPAPPISLSQSPNPPSLPYATYTVTATKEGYAPVEDYSIPVFDSVTSIQRVNMIPLAAPYPPTPLPPDQRIETPGYPNLDKKEDQGDESGR